VRRGRARRGLTTPRGAVPNGPGCQENDPRSSSNVEADGDRDIDLYHWSTPRFSSVWQDTLSVLVARGRARVSVSASAADWPKRIRDMQYVDHDDFAAAH
jgi:hypothetical protein